MNRDSDSLPSSLSETEAEEALAIQLAEMGEDDDWLEDPSLRSENQWAEETVKALEVMAVAEQTIAELVGSAKAGEPLDLSEMDLSVNQMNASLARDPEALLSLSMLREFDGEGFDHAINVSIYLMAMARSMELDEQTVTTIGMGGILHDIGKALLPQKLIHKITPLSGDERDQIESHVTISLDLLQEMKSGRDRIIPLIVSQHHERLDGSGYPNGLAGDKISLYGRMAAVCDCFDAMSSQRTYRKARPPNEVLGELMLEGRVRRRLDQELVERFVRVVGVYPVGSLVRLADGRVGVVMRNNPQDLLRPSIKVIARDNGATPITPQRLDLSKRPKGVEGLRIVSHESPASMRIDPMSFMPSPESYSTH
ncbi:HD-GYP domain-containing protein [Magnetofaba australis]|uniref:Putative metal dependent phosphohydrolase n=1 Tax=Magnetofaba australis IT-1 TaxID=1434232 RepID=A0A1Y2K3B9_9PROT|nr:HD-GYP domain-containing protein [Magnetofaba australis]OSM02511.1 putative metal dependent phosphohydrolase [Magnetofaba australis IT-1]